jgi:hypothetical protein
VLKEAQLDAKWNSSKRTAEIVWKVKAGGYRYALIEIVPLPERIHGGRD